MAFDKKAYMKEYSKKRYALKSEEIKTKSLQWKKDNPNKVKEYQDNNKDRQAKISKISYLKRKLNEYIVYLLPDSNYVGVTEKGIESMRFYNHEKYFNRNTDNVRILHTTKNRKDALELEELLHDMGYEG